MSVDNLEARQKSISKEKRRLTSIYKTIEGKRKNTIVGLIERAAFMRISLDELEEDLGIFGFTEKFSQGDQEPYDRKRPTADIYNSMNTSYQKIIKQLTDLLPKDEAERPKSDGFDDFVGGREDL